MATWTTPGHIVAGQTTGTATALQTYETDLNTIGGAWNTYTPTVTGPTLGTGGTATGYYVQAGKLCYGRYNITFGTSGTGAGVGTFYITLPFAVSSTTPAGTAIGSSFGTTAGVRFIAHMIVNGSSTSTVYFALGTGTQVLDNTHPGAWTANDYFRGSFVFETV